MHVSMVRTRDVNHNLFEIGKFRQDDTLGVRVRVVMARTRRRGDVFTRNWCVRSTS